jgi:hypothetical protein
MSNPPTQYIEVRLKTKDLHSLIEDTIVVKNTFVGNSMNLGMGLFNKYGDKMRGEGIQKMACLKGEGIKKWQNYVYIVVE